MRNFLHMILQDYEHTGTGFFDVGAFKFWHFFYMALIIGGIVALALIFKNKSEGAKKKLLDILPLIVIGLYISDLFLRPFIDLDGIFDQSIKGYLDKLPFHICTAMGIMSVFAQHSKKFQKIKEPLVIFGIVGPLMYLTYPDTVFGSRMPFCYNTVQTMAYHGVLLAWGVLCLVFSQPKASIKNWHKSLITLACLASWGLFGNILFSDMSSVDKWFESFDWFFLKSGAVLFKEELWAAIIAPFGVPLAMFATAMCVYGIYHLAKYIATKSQKTEKKVEEKETANV